jgi:uncharacterized protein (TIGR02302 family)
MDAAEMDRRLPRFSRQSLFTSWAAATLWFESGARAFWPAATLIGAFGVIALLGVPQALPPQLHVIALIAVACGVFYLIRQGLRSLAAPSRFDALRRLEQDSGLKHRPFEQLEDRPAGEPSQTTMALWRIHQQRRRAEIARLRMSGPRPGLPARDPWALRLLVCVTLVLALLVAGPRTGQRIAESLIPRFSESAIAIPIEAWIKPPSYTGLAPILLNPADKQTVSVPVGSTLEVHVSDGKHVPHLTEGGRRIDFKAIDGGGFSLSTLLTEPGEIAIRRGWSTLASWPIRIVPDNPPVVAFASRPTMMQSGALRVEYDANDDYGVASVDLRLILAPGHPNIAADPIDVVLTSGQNVKTLRASSYQDLTEHPWAGMAVIGRLVATDTAGQQSESAEMPLILPERAFIDPTAQAIVAARKHIILSDIPRFRVAAQLWDIANHPDLFRGDYSVYLALRAATEEARLLAQDMDRPVDTVEDLLWNAALKIEDGDRPEAERALRSAEDALEKALKDPKSTSSEIARLTQQLKEAMNRDIQAMEENLRQKQGQSAQAEQAVDPNARVVQPGDLDRQIDKIGDMAENGSRDAAQAMLDDIKSMLENLRAGQTPGKANPQGEKSLEELKALAKKQRDIEKGSEANAAEQQEALRQSLGNAARDVGEAMGNIPQSMGSADKAMRGAAKSLQRGAKGNAKGDQEEAAQQLDQAAKSLSEQLAQQGEGTEMKGDGDGDRDPLGRARFDKGSSVKVPTDREMQRSRAILEELRQRAGERERPRPELDYLNRLLQQY